MTHDSPTTRRFVRTAWIMLSFQLLAAAGAVGAAVWAFGAVRTLVNERAMLQARVSELEAAQNQAAPVAPPPPVVPPVAPPIDEPVAVPTPAPPTVTAAPTPAPPVRPDRPPQVRPPVDRPPVVTPPVQQPPVDTPPPYTPPPPVEDKPVYTPPPAPPRRPRPHIDLPGLIDGVINSLQDRPRRPDIPTRPPRTGDTPVPPNNSRPPATNVPGSTQTLPPRTTNTNPILRRVPRRPATTTPPPQQPVVR